MSTRVENSAQREGSRLVELLYFGGCPNHLAARAIVKRVIAEMDVEAELMLVKVPDAEAAARERFLGSPTIRVDGIDIEPGADQRTDFVLACRVYRTNHGTSGVPDEQWLRAALAQT